MGREQRNYSRSSEWSGQAFLKESHMNRYIRVMGGGILGEELLVQ